MDTCKEAQRASFISYVTVSLLCYNVGNCYFCVGNCNLSVNICIVLFILLVIDKGAQMLTMPIEGCSNNI
jgi:hypothetical protein